MALRKLGLEGASGSPSFWRIAYICNFLQNFFSRLFLKTWGDGDSRFHVFSRPHLSASLSLIIINVFLRCLTCRLNLLLLELSYVQKPCV